MADTVLMPQAGQSMTEGKIVQWFVKEGDSVRQGDPVLEIETDKANMDVEAPCDGVVRKIAFEAGATVEVLRPVAIIAGGDEDIDAESLLAAPSEAAGGKREEDAPAKPPETAKGTSGAGAGESPQRGSPPAPPSPSAGASAPAPSAPAPSTPAPAAAVGTRSGGDAGGNGGRLRASPLARRIASARGVDLTSLQGSGPRGRILKRDVESAAPAATPSGAPAPAATFSMPAEEEAEYPAPSPRPDAAVALEGMRKAIAEGLQRSKSQAPHFYVNIDVDVTETLAYRESLKARGDKISVNDLIVLATAIALRDEPRVNCRIHDDRIEYPREVNLGVAVGLDEGLVVPVLLRADEKNLRGIAEETRRVIDAARNGKLVGSGKGTFTISNLGMYGVESFSAVINPPEGAILAVGAAQPRLVPRGGGFFPRSILRLTLSADHRGIDGVLAAKFLARLKYLLEHPARLG